MLGPAPGAEGTPKGDPALMPLGPEPCAQCLGKIIQKSVLAQRPVRWLGKKHHKIPAAWLGKKYHKSQPLAGGVVPHPQPAAGR